MLRAEAFGYVRERPVEIESDRDVLAFILTVDGGGRSDGGGRGRRVEVCEVVCAGPVAECARTLNAGDAVSVRGRLFPTPFPAHNLDDPETQFVRLELHADCLTKQHTFVS